MKFENLLFGLKWSFLERASVIVLQIILEILLARLLLPADYGILGMIAVVVAFANVFIDGGFSNALIHFQDRTVKDEAAVFYLSMFIGLLSYVILYVAAPSISLFYSRDLTLLLRVIGIGIIFNAFGVLYRAKMVIDLNFKSQTKFSILSMVVSGIAGVVLAIKGFGVWSLVAQTLIYTLLFNMFLFLNFRTVPISSLETKSLRRITGFGSKIFLSSVIHALYFNAYPVILGKVHTPQIVGLYSKANQLSVYPAGLFASVLQRVFFPYLSGMQQDQAAVYRLNLTVIKWYAMAVFPVAGLVVFFAPELIVWLLSDRWDEIVLPLQILLSAAAFFPIIILNMNILQVLGKGGLFLRTEVLTKCIGIVSLFLTFRSGFSVICCGILLQIILQWVITSIISSKILGMNSVGQLFTVSRVVLSNVFLIGFLEIIRQWTDYSGVWYTVLSIAFFAMIYLMIIRYFYLSDLLQLKHLLLKRKE